MPGKNLDLDAPPLAQGLGYRNDPVPSNDAASTSSADRFEVLGAINSMPAPCEVMSIASKEEDAPPLGAFQLTNLHDTNWLDPTKPHMSPESQKG